MFGYFGIVPPELCDIDRIFIGYDILGYSWHDDEMIIIHRVMG